MEAKTRVALLIDAENVSAARSDEVFDLITPLGDAVIRRAYGSWTSTHLRGWAEVAVQRGIRMEHHSQYAVGKNASDIALAVDAVHLSHTVAPDVFAIVTSDSDFTPVVTFLRESGADVYGIGGRQASQAYRAACTRFLEFRPSTEDGEAASDGRGRSPERLPIDDRLVKKVRRAVDKSEGAKGWVSLSTVRKNLGPQFRPKDYGHANMSKLIDALGGFEVRNAGTPQVAVRVASAN